MAPSRRPISAIAACSAGMSLRSQCRYSGGGSPSCRSASISARGGVVGDVEERDLRALAGELGDLLGADAAGAAGDQDDAVVQARVDGEDLGHARVPSRAFSWRIGVGDFRLRRCRRYRQ